MLPTKVNPEIKQMEEQGYTYKYPHPAVTTDCVVFGVDGHKLKILLIERGNEPYKGYWAFPGGFLNMDENTEQGALRELKEETGLVLQNIKEFGTFSEVNRDPRERVISIAFYAIAKTSEVKGGDDAAKAQWFALDEVPRLAFDHDLMLKNAIQKLKEELMKRITPEFIRDLKPTEIFVFGSNLAGAHGGGAAYLAYQRFGAVMGQGVGLQGQSYAIPTMQGGPDTILPYVEEFIAFAKQHPELTFLVTKIGCGIAGFMPSEIAPLFAGAVEVENIYLPQDFWEELI